MIVPFDKHIWNQKSITNSEFGSFFNATSSTALTGTVKKKTFIAFTQHTSSVENCISPLPVDPHQDLQSLNEHLPSSSLQTPT